MVSTQPADAPSPPESDSGVKLFDMIRGYISTELLYVTAKLQLPDLIASGVRTTHDIAERTQTNPAALQRVLQGLAYLGVCTHDDDGGFSLTPIGAMLTTDHPSGFQNVAIVHKEILQPAVSEMLYSVQTGNVGIERAHGASLFGYLSDNPDAGQRFDRFMGTVSGETARALIAAYDFSSVGTVVDVGGGQGTLVTAILKRYPATRGVVFDLPQVTERARQYVSDNGVANRCEVVSGDFFSSVPSGGDVYLLSQILHDWDDAKCQQLLSVIHQAMTPDSRLLVLERILPERVTKAAPSVPTDLIMLTVTGGQERTEQDYHRLLADSGFGNVSVIPMSSPFSIIEARKGLL